MGRTRMRGPFCPFLHFPFKANCVTRYISTVQKEMAGLQVDVGPTSAGVIPPIMQERLLQMGEWLGNNGEAVR